MTDFASTPSTDTNANAKAIMLAKTASRTKTVENEQKKNFFLIFLKNDVYTFFPIFQIENFLE